MVTRNVEPIKVNGETLYIEVTDIEGPPSEEDDYEYTSADELVDAGERIHSTLGVLAATVQEAFKKAPPAEWTLEINLGFKGKAGIPFITEGEANGAVKVSATWKRDQGHVPNP